MSGTIGRFEPIEQLRAHEYVAEQLRRQIGLHLIPVGHPLPTERELSAMFGVGRATVEAAIRVLEAERLVETHRGRKGGTFVIAYGDDELAMDYLLVRLRRDRDRIKQALQFRRNLEMFAAALAAKGRNAGDLEEIRVAHAHTAEGKTDPDFMRFDTAFHLAIAHAAHNSFVYEAVEQMRLTLSDAVAVLPDSRRWQLRTLKEHAAVLDAIERRDADAASEAMGRHVAATEKNVDAMLKAL
jgi:GntR family transcriptional repressor for pyruvate dehydrogenase complex